MIFIFGNLAIVSLLACPGYCFRTAAQDLDPRLCVPDFQRVCYFRILTDDIIATSSMILPFTSVIWTYKSANVPDYCGSGIATTKRRPQLMFPFALMQVWKVRWWLPV